MSLDISERDHISRLHTDPETESGWTYGAPGHLAAIRLGAVRKANKVSLEAARLARFAIEATIMLDDE